MTYHAHVARGERYWIIHVPEVDRFTQARSLGEVEEMARDLIAVMNDVEPDSFKLNTSVELPGSVREHLHQAEQLREQAQHANHEAAQQSRLAVRELVESGMSQREAAKALGMSFQRVNQLVQR